MDRQVVVQIADMKLTRTQGKLITYALGSCIGITIYDTRIKLAALIHIMLPESLKGINETSVYKFADTGIKETLRKMAVLGGVKSSYVCKIAGGAKMFATTGNSSLSNIGKQNIDAVIKILKNEGIHITGQEVGGSIARTMILDVETGAVTIRSIGKPDIKL